MSTHTQETLKEMESERERELGRDGAIARKREGLRERE